MIAFLRTPPVWLLPGLLGLLAVAEAVHGGVVLAGSRWTFAATALLAAALLCWRRRAPLLVLGSFGAITVLSVSLGSHAESLAEVLAVVVAIFSVGRHAPRPRGYLGLPLGFAVTLSGSATAPGQTLGSSWGWALNSVWIFAIGAWMRTQHDLVEAGRAESEERVRAGVAEERLRIARELHDVLAHSLSVVVVQAETASELLDAQPEVTRAALDRIQQTGREALVESRWMLRTVLDPDETAHPEPGLAGIADLVERVRASGVPVHVHEGLDDAHVGATVGRALYRVVQESLTNALRHAPGAPTEVRLATHDEVAVVEVTNGPATAPGVRGDHHGSGHGLLGMRERVEACGGRFSAGPDGAGGFLVRAELPLEVGVTRPQPEPTS
ncbi:MAG: sensor histidine kinase [Actinomycetes bacterium]